MKQEKILTPKFCVFALTMVLNYWFWRIASYNLAVFILVIFASLLLYLTIFIDKKYTKYLIFLFILIFFFQYTTNNITPLNYLSDDQIRIKQERINSYKPFFKYERSLFYRLKLREFFEGDYAISVTNLQRNFFESIDPNVYFFAGHPRERVWASDFEKFPFIFIVPFIIGLYKLKLPKFISFYILLSLVLLSLIGHINNLGPFILFPFFVVIIFRGFEKILKFFKVYE